MRITRGANSPGGATPAKKRRCATNELRAPGGTDASLGVAIPGGAVRPRSGSTVPAWRRNDRHSSSAWLSSGSKGMLGGSTAMLEIFHKVERFGAALAPVLITGESGTGKELAARAIHDSSSCADGPFVAINCGALCDTLVASELFGHEKGAFTGAQQRHIGRIEAANGGTVLLDEIGDLPLDMQPQLLRFLQESTIERVGSTMPIKLKVRVVAATNKDLWRAVTQGRFREDLFYRLNVLSIEMPPLRARDGDIALLADRFLAHLSRESGERYELTPAAMVALQDHSWPGNVRELLCCLRKAIVLADPPRIDVENLDLFTPVSADMPCAGTAPDSMTETDLALADVPMTLAEARDRVEAALLHRTLTRCAQRVSQAARELGVSRVTLYRLMEKHGLR